MQLRPYQEIGRDFLASRTRALLADQMRVGKTPQAILAAQKIGAQRVLVLCPAIAVGQWAQEWERWANVAAVVYQGGAVPAGRVHVVASYQMAQRHIEHFDPTRWDVLIVDECHKAKNPEAGITSMVYGKNGLGWRAEYIWALSGTPAPNHAGELWPMLRAFGVVDMTYDEFIRRYCIVLWRPQRQIVGTRERMIPELRGLLAKCMLRRTRAEVAPEMPAIDYQFLSVEPDLALVSALLENAGEARADLARLGSALQDRSNPAAYIEDHARDFTAARQYCAYAKVPVLADHVAFALDNNLLQQTVVFGHHVGPLQCLREQLVTRGTQVELIQGETSAQKRQEIMRDFQAGKIQVLVANIIAAGTAIDLSAADHGYFLEMSWVPANNEQAANRLVSLMKAQGVTFDIVVWEGSPDATVNAALARKTRELSQLY